MPDETPEITPDVKTVRPSSSFSDLIKLYETAPPMPIVLGLINVGDVALIHGTEECFKSVLIIQLAADLATGADFLGLFPSSRPWKVGVLETEMHPVQMGGRLKSLFKDTIPPKDAIFLSEEALRAWRRQDFAGKFTLLERWISHEGIEILIIDTANDFFRGDISPNDETKVGEFFDRLRNIPLSARIIVRHDRKQHEADIDLESSNERIRGASEWREDPECILYMRRKDRRVNRVRLEAGKIRYGVKPESLDLFFDSGTFSLTPLNPVIALLLPGSLSREEIITLSESRFGVGNRKADEFLKENRPYLDEISVGHQKLLSLAPISVLETAPWFKWMPLKFLNSR